MIGFSELPARGVLALGGDDRIPFLGNLITNDVSDSTARYALLLSPQGKFLHDMFVVPRPTELLIDCEADRAADLLQRLTRYKLRSAVTFRDATADYAVVALAPAQPITAPAAHSFIDPRHGQLGQRLLVARDWLPDLKARCLALDLAECTPDDYDKHRLALGVPDGSRDLEPDRAFPMDYGMDRLAAINFEKGCYIGQELTARMKYRGLVKKQLCRVQITGVLPPAGTSIMAGEYEAGTLFSGNGQLALALLRNEYIEQPLTCANSPISLLK